MEVRTSDPVENIEPPQRFINNLISVLALPSIRSGGETSQMMNTLLEALLGILRLDFAYARLKDPVPETSIVAIKTPPSSALNRSQQQICNSLNHWFGDDPRSWPPQNRNQLGDEEISMFAMPLGLQGEFGLIVAGSKRASFPEQTERLLLNVATNQAVLGLQQAQLLSEQKRVASELDHRAAERTAANEELRREIVEREVTEEKVRLSEHALREAHARVAQSEERWRSVFENSAIGVVLCNPDCRFIASNPVFQRMVGYTQDELHELTFFDITVEQFREYNWTLIRELLEGKRRQFQIEKQLRRKDGSLVWVRNNVSAVPGSERLPRFLMALSEDITERKRAEEALRASELSLREIFDNIPGLVNTLGPDGEAKLINRQVLEYLGKTPEELINWRFSNAIHPDDLPRIVALHAASIAPGVPFSSEYRLRRVDGVYRWFHFRAEPVRDAAGSVSGWYVLATDIHERKQAEEALQASERNLWSIINTIPTLSWSARPDGYVDFLSQGWLDFTGLSLEQAQGWGWSSAIHPLDRENLVKLWQSVLASGTQADAEARMRRFDGVYRWSLIRANPWRDESGSIVKWYGTNTDIDDRKQAEGQVRRSEAFLTEAQYLTRVGSFSWRPATNKIKWSDQLYRIFEFEQGAAMTIELIVSRVHPDDLALMLEMTEKARHDVSDFEFDHRLLMPDRSIKYLRVIAHAIRSPEGGLEYIGAIQDVTQRQLEQDALAKARTQLEHVANTTGLGMLAASIAHEINQPLSGMMMNSGTCLRMLDADPPNIEGARETVQRTIRDGSRASDVIKHLRTLFSGREIVLEPVDLNEATREVVTLLLGDLQRSRILVQHQFADDLPLIKGDRTQLQQVILNLLRNASESMSSVEDRPRQLLLKAEREEGNRVRFMVQDSGVGFNPGDSHLLFQPFHTTKTEGMGIGLSISRSIIQAHQGRIWAKLNDGPGSTFAFSIPCDPESEAGADDSPAAGP
jgi:PAS domain S-box-containing protein